MGNQGVQTGITAPGGEPCRGHRAEGTLGILLCSCKRTHPMQVPFGVEISLIRQLQILSKVITGRSVTTSHALLMGWVNI